MIKNAKKDYFYIVVRTFDEVKNELLDKSQWKLEWVEGYIKEYKGIKIGFYQVDGNRPKSRAHIKQWRIVDIESGLWYDQRDTLCECEEYILNKLIFFKNDMPVNKERQQIIDLIKSGQIKTENEKPQLSKKEIKKMNNKKEV